LSTLYIRNQFVPHREQWIPIGQIKNLMSFTGKFNVYRIVHQPKTNKTAYKNQTEQTNTMCG